MSAKTITKFEYKAIPAPRRSKRIKGVRGSDQLFATVLSQTLNDMAAQGWHYVRAESLPADERPGLFKSRVEVLYNLLIFKREKAALTDSPPLSANTSEELITIDGLTRKVAIPATGAPAVVIDPVILPDLQGASIPAPTVAPDKSHTPKGDKTGDDSGWDHAKDHDGGIKLSDASDTPSKNEKQPA